MLSVPPTCRVPEVLEVLAATLQLGAALCKACDVAGQLAWLQPRQLPPLRQRQLLLRLWQRRGSGRLIVCNAQQLMSGPSSCPPLLGHPTPGHLGQ
jgi:hypothetical protein